MAKAKRGVFGTIFSAGAQAKQTARRAAADSRAAGSAADAAGDFMRERAARTARGAARFARLQSRAYRALGARAGLVAAGLAAGGGGAYLAYRQQRGASSPRRANTGAGRAG